MNNHPDDAHSGDLVHAIKAYDNSEWLHSRGARHVRIMCEYLETQNRLRKEGVMGTILFFGSARALERSKWKTRMAELEKEVEKATGAEKEEALTKLRRTTRLEWLCEYYEKVALLSKKVTEWAQSDEAREYISRILESLPSPVTSEGYGQIDAMKFKDSSKYPTPLIVCTGGGPGLMEAANRGAKEVPGGRSAGMGVTLPHEAGLNKYVNPTLAFRFHYFFTRKFWMLYTCLALVVTPGGIGTADELMEVLTLRQTGKIKRNIPVVLLGEKYWKDIFNFDKMIEYGTITEKDRDQLFYTDDVEAAFQHILKYLTSDMLIVEDHKSMRSKRPLADPKSPSAKSVKS